MILYNMIIINKYHTYSVYSIMYHLIILCIKHGGHHTVRTVPYVRNTQPTKL